MTICFLTTFILVILLAVVESHCPPINPDTGCSCKTLVDHDKDEFSILTCRRIDSEEDLKRILRRTRSYPMFELELLESNLRFIPHDAFIGTSFEVLSIRNSSINALSDTDIAFEGLEKQLHLIEIINCSYTSNFDWTHLSNLVHVMEIHISDSELIDITEGISKVQHIDVESFAFQNNHIEVLDERAFAPFTSLKRLALDNNHISRLSRSMFPRPAKQLKILGLSYNNLRELPEDLFVEMTGLSSLYLTGNPLYTIREAVFRPVWNQLNIFLFYGTNLSCDCRLAWLLKTDNSKKYIHAICQGPAEFNGQQLVSIDPDHLYC